MLIRRLSVVPLPTRVESFIFFYFFIFIFFSFLFFWVESFKMIVKFKVAQTVNNLPAVQATQVRSLNWEDPLEKGRGWLPTLVFLPGESHGQKSLEDCSPWGRKESYMTERLTLRK